MISYEASIHQRLKGEDVNNCTVFNNEQNPYHIILAMKAPDMTKGETIQKKTNCLINAHLHEHFIYLNVQCT